MPITAHNPPYQTSASLACLLLALIWGAAWALALQHTRWGRYLAARRTWVAVVIGIGVDLLIALPIVPQDAWLTLVAIFALSSIGIIARSLRNEQRADEEIAAAVAPNVPVSTTGHHPLTWSD